MTLKVLQAVKIIFHGFEFRVVSSDWTFTVAIVKYAGVIVFRMMSLRNRGAIIMRTLSWKKIATTGKMKATGTSAPKLIVFEVAAAPGSEVFIAGTFNEWNPEKHPLSNKKNNGVYSCALLLEPGKYEYKFRIDGVWSVDPNNPDFADNGFGTMNSVLVVE